MNFVEDLLPIVVAIGIFMVPIVAILTEHQRKMAKLFHEGRSVAPTQDPMLVDEVRRLRELVAQQAIAIDNLSQKLDRKPAPAIEERINS